MDMALWLLLLLLLLRKLDLYRSATVAVVLPVLWPPPTVPPPAPPVPCIRSAWRRAAAWARALVLVLLPVVAVPALPSSAGAGTAAASDAESMALPISPPVLSAPPSAVSPYAAVAVGIRTCRLVATLICSPYPTFSSSYVLLVLHPLPPRPGLSFPSAC